MFLRKILQRKSRQPNIMKQLDDEGKAKWMEYRRRFMDIRAKAQELRRDMMEARQFNDRDRMAILRKRVDNLRSDGAALRSETKSFLESHGIQGGFMDMKEPPQSRR